MQQNFTEIFLDQKEHNGPWLRLGVLRGEHNPPGRAGGPGAPWWVVPTSGAPGPPLCSIKTPILPKPLGSQRKSIPGAASSRTTRSNLDTITEGFIILIGASPIMRE